MVNKVPEETPVGDSVIAEEEPRINYMLTSEPLEIVTKTPMVYEQNRKKLMWREEWEIQKQQQKNSRKKRNRMSASATTRA